MSPSIFSYLCFIHVWVATWNLALTSGEESAAVSALRVYTEFAPWETSSSSSVFPPLGRFNRSVPLHPTPQGAHYMVDVDIGSKANSTATQTLRLVLDTGSGDLVIFGRSHCLRRQGMNHVVDGNGCFQYQDSESFQFNSDPTPGRRVNANCQFNLPDHPGTYCREALLIDGYKAELFCELGWDDVQFGGLSSLADQTAIRTDVCIVNDTETANYKMRYWNNTQGTVGMFYQVCQPGTSKVVCETPFPPLLGSIPRSMHHTFSLDLNRHGQESWMHFGEPEGGWQGMEWSETQPIGLAGRTGTYSFPYAFHTFEIYHLSVCGADLLSNYSSHWTAMVDTGATCLTLPQEFFDMVKAWVPALDCVSESVADFDYSDCVDSQCSAFKPITVCYLREGAQPSDLPTLVFSIDELVNLDFAAFNQFIGRMSENGRPLYLPLSGLMINDRPSGRDRVCLNPADSISSYQADQAMKYLLYFPKISFGTLALKNLFTTFDMQAMAIGMRNKVEYGAEGSTRLCADNAVCVGAQTWYRPMNFCQEPPCDTLYFHEINPTTHQCQIQPGFLACVIITLLTFTFAEVALSEIYEKLAYKLATQYAVST